jgi:hypothetical protein
MRCYAYMILGFESVLFLSAGCKEHFIPPSIPAQLGYLVVDGVILNGQDTTVINLSRTQNISDSAYTKNPESGAQVSIIGQNSEVYPLSELSKGTYVIGELSLNSNEVYFLKIITSNGNQYLSDSLAVKFNPPIDSISWKRKDEGVYIYANTHDTTNNTRYYHWEYVETWEYHSAYFSAFKVANGGLVLRDSTEYVNQCWTTIPSTNLLLGSSINLSQDIIFEYPVMFIPSGAEKLSVEYSILVKQYTLSREAFNYWQILQKNTEQTGSLFDPQPTQLSGNIHCTSNTNEQALGYISITSRHQQRIFISNNEVPNWPYEAPGLNCPRYLVNPSDPSFPADYWSTCGCLPLYEYSAPNFVTEFWTTKPPSCADCTLQGGVTTKPSFWPN